MKIKGELLFSLGLVLLIAFLIIETMRYNELARLVPLVVLVPALFFGLIQVVLDARAAKTPEKTEPEKASEEPREEKKGKKKKQKLAAGEKTQRELIAFAWLFGFFALIVVAGLSAAIPVFVLVFMRFFGKESWRLSLIFAIGCWAFVYLVFVVGLKNDLYPGIILPMLTG